MSDEKETQISEQAMTTVVNIHYEEYDVYIGRKGRGKDGYFCNPFGSPWTKPRISAKEAIEKFVEHFYQRIKTDSVYRERILLLRGKRLGCFCKPRDCHGDIIAEFVNAHFEKRDQTSSVSKSSGSFDGELREKACKVREANLPEEVLKAMPDVQMIDGVPCGTKAFEVWYNDNKAFITTRLLALEKTPEPIETPRRTAQQKDHQLYEDKLRAMLEA